MAEMIECIYVGNVLKPVIPLHLTDGERVIVHIEKRIPFETIKIKKKIVREDIRCIRNESWMPL